MKPDSRESVFGFFVFWMYDMTGRLLQFVERLNIPPLKRLLRASRAYDEMRAKACEFGERLGYIEGEVDSMLDRDPLGTFGFLWASKGEAKLPPFPNPAHPWFSTLDLITKGPPSMGFVEPLQ